MNGVANPEGGSWSKVRRRRDAIVALVQRTGSCEIAVLAEHTGASEATIRRDLIVLEAQGVLERTWGAATVRIAVNYPEALEGRAGMNRAAKHAIALEASSLVQPNMVIGISGGTTCTSLARMLRGNAINVVTNAVNVAVEFFGARQTKLIMTGGSLKTNSYELVGTTADSVIRQYHLDLMFFSCSGVDEGGFNRRDHAEAAVVRTFRSVADRSVVLVDSGKVGIASPARVSRFDDASMVICDAATPDVWLDRYASGGAEVRMVRLEEPGDG